MSAQQIQALIVADDAFLNSHFEKVVELALQYKLPAIYATHRHITVGGLLSYRPLLERNFYRAAGYADKIIKGAKPGDLPIEQPSSFELIVNLNAAKALGLTIPPEIMVRADRVVQ
jgi:putative ABC transport system substrate-binding protein